MNIIRKSPERPKPKCIVHCSHQTAATIDEGKKGKNLDKFKLNQTIQNSVALEIEDLLKEEEPKFYEKNKWIRRMNSLASEGIRETIEPQYDGERDVFSQEFLRADEPLHLLGNMGK